MSSIEAPMYLTRKRTADKCVSELQGSWLMFAPNLESPTLQVVDLPLTGPLLQHWDADEET